ncbi:membrane protein insertion efficiency factor YidD [Candidatus Riesia pediculischaeffi]|uniref:membrane protein insertion efficiency factor YidD n=1 Tax=Candidatus Riesia pediculischaeffi TaxID=428411 RepID=UPI0005853A89|nr:membrane protein insertion efficiency factor YidD [Candidatus Riesia pediculischaeffi]
MGKISYFSKVIIFLIKIYQKTVSPFLGKNCRFKICCSEYSIRMIRRLGLTKGIYCSAKRILTCNPLYFCKKNMNKYWY